MPSKLFPILVLVLDALVFAITGSVFLFSPMSPLGTLGVVTIAPEALTDIRAVYGGIELAIAAYLVIRIIRRKDLHDPLLLVTLIFTAMVITRAYGMVVDSSAVRISIILLTVEAAGAALNAAAYWRAKRET